MFIYPGSVCFFPFKWNVVRFDLHDVLKRCGVNRSSQLGRRSSAHLQQVLRPSAFCQSVCSSAVCPMKQCLTLSLLSVGCNKNQPAKQYNINYSVITENITRSGTYITQKKIKINEFYSTFKVTIHSIICYTCKTLVLTYHKAT